MQFPRSRISSRANFRRRTILYEATTLTVSISFSKHLRIECETALNRLKDQIKFKSLFLCYFDLNTTIFSTTCNQLKV